jgi:hypothetical protein
MSPAAAKVYGVAIMLAPLLMLASTIAYVTVGEGINVGVLGGVIGVWAAFALAIGFVGLLRLLEPSAPRAAAVLTVLALTGFTAGAVFNVNAAFDALVGPELEAAIDAAIDRGGADAMLILAFLPWGFFGPITMLATGVLLWRTRTTPRWSAALLAAGGVLFVASRPERIDVLALIADGVLVLALLPIGWAMLTRAPSSPAGDPVRTAAVE